MVPFGHTSVNVATRMKHVFHTPFLPSRERWVVILKLPLKSVAQEAEPGFIFE